MNPAASALLGRQPRRMRRVARCLSVCLLVTGMFAGLLLSASPAAAVAGFGDVDDGVYYSEPVQWMVDNNIVTDTTGPCFAPHTPATRGETALYMWRMEGQPEAPAHPFDDVTNNDQHPAVAWMNETEITTGTSPTTFGPGQQLTRAQLAAFLHRLAGEPSASGHPFVDVVAGWQQQPVAWMVANEITTGTSPTTFAPNEPVTRGQLATFLYRYQNSPTVTVDPHSPECGDFTAVDSGSQHSCAIRTNGTITCWGNNEYDKAVPPEGLFKAVSAGDNHSCGLRTDNTISCWGGVWTRTTNALGGPFTAVSAGAFHACGLRTDATISCWGANGQGQTDAPDGQFTVVSARYDHTCGIRTDATITCWGDNQRNQTDTPDGQFTAISAGNYHSCALRTDATITCWGQSIDGQTNAPDGQFSVISAGIWRSCGIRIDATITCWGSLWGGHPVAPDGQFNAISTGLEHTCALSTNNAVTCWGNNWAEQTTVPDGQFNAISAGTYHSCGVRTDNSVTCWGENISANTHAPFGSFTAISAGNGHTCGIRTNGTITCWGANWDGQTDAPDGKFTAISAGNEHTCGIRTDSTITCWGNNWAEQTTVPDGQFYAISAGASHTCGIRLDGAITCWGNNGHGQANAQDGQFSSLSAGRIHTCGIRLDDSVACWGYNFSGQTEAPSGQFSAISAGGDHVCGILADTTIKCWGNETSTEAGSFTALSSGLLHSCGILTDATITCWSELIAPTPPNVQFAGTLVTADPRMCQPFGNPGDGTAGFPPPWNAVPTKGTARVAVLFVDFINASASYSTQIEAEMGLTYAEAYLEASSYQSLDVEFVILHRWLRAEHGYDHYQNADWGHDGVGPPIDSEAIRLADPDFDFTNIDALMVVLPSSHFHGGTATNSISTDEGSVARRTQINQFPLDEVRDPSRWGHVAAHELIHNFGLLDLYASEGVLGDVPDAPEGKIWVTYRFGLMGLGTDFPAEPQDPRLTQVWLHPDGVETTSYATRLEAEEMLAWSRWQLGWLDSTQISCIAETETEATVTLGPVADPGDNIAMAAIPLSATELIVIEARQEIGYDNPRIEHYFNGVIGTFPALVSEGVLVYTVDASRVGGQLPLVIAGDTGNLQVDRYPILTDGESVTISGYTITVESNTDTTYTVTITKNTE